MSGAVIGGLGGPMGFGETAVARSDDGSVQFDVSSVFTGGFTYFGTYYSGSQLYVNTNGTLSFGTPFAPYPTPTNTLDGADVIGAFWADVDTRIDGEGFESGQIWLDIDTANAAVTVTWENTGVYRYDATQTNLFQVRLVNQGAGDFDIELRYARIDWTVGSANDDAGAAPQLSAARLPLPVMLGDAATLDTRLGNTGVTGFWSYDMRGGTVAGQTPANGVVITATAPAGQTLEGDALHDILRGGPGPDVLRGYDGDDWLFGNDGPDTLNAGSGDDFIFGGASDADLRDVIYGGDGNDNIDAGHGNDLVYGGAGDDTLAGGFGADELIGQGGNDQLSGAALSDLIFGGDGIDFINGGFGYARLNGAAGADRFYHLGIFDHGSDWIQDYNATEGDLLVWGGPNTAVTNFQINYANTANAGDNTVEEAFIIYRSTGQIIWALVDGAAQPEINIRIGAATYDLL